MCFWDTFLATFLANVAALGLFAIPILAIWPIIRDRDHRIRRFFSLRFKRLSLRLQFRWLVFRGKRRKSEFHSWYHSETFRNYLTRLVSEAPKAYSQMMADTLRITARIVSIHDEMLLRSPGGLLREAVGGMSTNDFTSQPVARFGSMSPSQRADWLASQTYSELARWAIRLDPDDRREWLSWLESQDGQTELETAFIGATKCAARQDTPEAD